MATTQKELIAGLVAAEAIANSEECSARDRTANALALAVIAHQQGNSLEAQEWAQTCVEEASKINTSALKSVAHGGMILGVPIPDYLHPESALQALRGYGIKV